MTKELAHELVQNWIASEVRKYGATHFKLPVHDQIIYSKRIDGQHVEYTLVHCLSVLYDLTPKP